MKMGLRFVFLLTVVYAAISQVLSQDQEGFISLDCGLVPKDSTYTDTTTNITYTSDWKYIDSGESKRIDSKLTEKFQRQMWYARSFPEGVRNCYNFNLTKGSKYLIRASFLYGNYDGLKQLPSFDVHMGPNLWGAMEITLEDSSQSLEIIHVLTSDSLQICLAKTGLSTPFISALELRPLKNNTYKTQVGSLELDTRRYFSTAKNFIRFDEDIHDRGWAPLFYPQDWNLLSTSLAIDFLSNSYDVPQAVLRTAVVPKNASEAMVLTWNDKDLNSQYHVFMHFAEIELLKANESRKFNISVNGGTPYGPYSPPNFTLGTLFTISAVSSKNGSYDVTFQRTEGSTHPPLINGLEIYKVIELTQLETDPNDVSAIKNIEATYGLNKANWNGDPCNPPKYVWDAMNCSYKNFSPPRVTSLNLSASGLKGGIAPSIFNLTQLISLDLSNNNLTGEVPGFLGEMKSLTFINLSGNQLNGSIPKSLLDKKSDGSLTLNDDGNPNLCTSDSCNSKPSKKNNFIVPVAAAGAALIVILAVLLINFALRKKKRTTNEEPPAPSIIQSEARSNRSSEPSIITKERMFTYSELLKMTNSFERVLGKGGFGMVYHGFLNGTEQVAVKMLSESSAQGYKQFKAEVELLLRVHHKNLVNLVGYCDDGNYLALIYEYMANGDLKEHMSEQQGNSVLNWACRLKIASESAQGLEYLHNGCRPQIVHRDVKTTNILLNDHFQAKLADFGLSRSFPLDGETHVSTVVAGTPGYLDPDYYRTNWLTEKSDVYSFGIVLLEIITNLQVIDNSREKPHIADWVRIMVNRGDIESIVDRKLRGDYDTNTVWKTIEVALNCVNVTSSLRPTMSQVVMELNECLAIETARTQRSPELSTPEVSMSYINTFAPGAR